MYLNIHEHQNVLYTANHGGIESSGHPSNIFIAKKLPALIQTTARTFTKNDTPNNDTNLQLFFLPAFYGRTIQCPLWVF